LAPRSWRGEKEGRCDGFQDDETNVQLGGESRNQGGLGQVLGKKHQAENASDR